MARSPIAALQKPRQAALSWQLAGQSGIPKRPASIETLSSQLFSQRSRGLPRKCSASHPSYMSRPLQPTSLDQASVQRLHSKPSNLLIGTNPQSPRISLLLLHIGSVKWLWICCRQLHLSLPSIKSVVLLLGMAYKADSPFR